MRISVVVPACDAQTTIGRAVRSLQTQTWPDWEAVIVADDGFDYRGFAEANGFADPRVTFVTTGAVRSGCHNARNIGLAAARGDLIAALDADDVYRPTRLEVLALIARRLGAACDNHAVVSETTGEVLYRALGEAPSAERLSAAQVLGLSVPLFPLVRRDLAEPRLPGIEYGEDFVANLRLIDRIGGLPVVAETLLEYRVVRGSLSHADNSAAAFDASYGALLGRLEHGDGLGLSPPTRAAALDGIARKRAFNRAFADAQTREPALDFQTFASRTVGRRLAL